MPVHPPSFPPLADDTRRLARTKGTVPAGAAVFRFRYQCNPRSVRAANPHLAGGAARQGNAGDTGLPGLPGLRPRLSLVVRSWGGTTHPSIPRPLTDLIWHGQCA